MKKSHKLFIFPLLIISICLTCVMPFNILYADSQTYYTLDTPYQSGYSFACVVYGNRDNKDYSIRNNSLNVETRTVILKGSTYYYVYLVGLSSFTGVTHSNINCNNGVSGSQSSSKTYNNINYYVLRSSQLTNNATTFNYDVPVIETNDYASYDYAYRYTFGDLAANSPTYGSLKTGYSTKFVSENFVGVDSHNIDTITWEETDTNGNFLMSPGSMVEIRAVPGYFEAPSKTVLETQTITNFIKGLWAKSPLPNSVVDIQPVEYYTIGRFSPNKKSVDIMWKDVVDTFWYDSEQPFLGSLYSEIWYKIGWRYEIRFYVGDYENPDYVSDWQTIYQITSVDVQTSNNVIQQAPQGLTPELYNLLQTVNTLNNTVQNWNINGVPIQFDPNNTPTQDNSWIEKLIESIANMFGKLIEAIGDIVSAILGLGSDIINGIFNLINNLGINILDTFTDLWNNFINLFNGIDFTDENSEFDIDFNLTDGDSPLDVVPAFVRMIYDSGLGYILWMPLIVGIIFMIV